MYLLSAAVSLLGKIDELRKKHAVEMADFEKAQTINKARTTQGLQEKLQARRSRRSRMQNHEKEIEAMQSAWHTCSAVQRNTLLRNLNAKDQTSVFKDRDFGVPHFINWYMCFLTLCHSFEWKHFKK